MTHELKTWPEHFEEVNQRRKTFEIRYHDRQFEVGDTLILYEYDNDQKAYTGRSTGRTITHILQGGQFGIDDNYVILSIQ